MKPVEGFRPGFVEEFGPEECRSGVIDLSALLTSINKLSIVVLNPVPEHLGMHLRRQFEPVLYIL